MPARRIALASGMLEREVVDRSDMPAEYKSVSAWLGKQKRCRSALAAVWLSWTATPEMLTARLYPDESGEDAMADDASASGDSADERVAVSAVRCGSTYFAPAQYDPEQIRAVLDKVAIELASSSPGQVARLEAVANELFALSSAAVEPSLSAFPTGKPQDRSNLKCARRRCFALMPKEKPRRADDRA